MQILETFAKSEKEALDLGASYLEVDASMLELTLHKKGGSGFLGMGNKNPSVYHINAIPEKTPKEVVAKGVTATLLSYLGFSIQFTNCETREDGKLYLEMSSTHAGHIIGRKGKTLESLQFLVNLMVEKFLKEPPKILLDIEKYRSRREDQITSMAVKSADQVVKSGRSKLLNPLNPYERRLVHVALQEREDVTTESQGNGVYKRVRIMPLGEGGQPIVTADMPDNTDDSQTDNSYDSEDYYEEQSAMAKEMQDSEE